MKKTKATLEWHWYCPHCGRSCLSPFDGVYNYEIVKTCSSCGKKYSVKLETNYKLGDDLSSAHFSGDYRDRLNQEAIEQCEEQ